MIVLLLLHVTSCSETPPPTSNEEQQPSNLAVNPIKQLVPRDELQMDSPSLIQVKSGDGSYVYHLFGSNGAWATSADLRNWDELTAQGDFNHNGIANEPNDRTLGFPAFKASNETTPGDSYDASGYYYQLSKTAGKGILWANDANGDEVVDATLLAEESGTKEADTIGLWSPDVVQLEDGDYYFYYSHCNLPGTSYCSDSHAYMGVAKAPSVEGPYENVSVFMQSHGQVGDGASDQVPGYDGTAWQPQHHPAALFPDVFLDKEGQPWLVYGSGAGGIWVKRLNPRTGLPDDIDEAQRSYGTRIAGGYLSPIDNPSIWYSTETGYYYLLLTYMGADTRDQVAFNIRVARARAPEGPYFDAAGRDLSQMHAQQAATSDAFVLDEAETARYGVKLMGGHSWQSELGGSMKQADYWSPGNASIFADTNTRKTFLLFDAATSRSSGPRYARLHELYFTDDGWPVVAPHPYVPRQNERTVKPEDVIGDYQLIHHGSDNNVAPHKSMFIHLAADGTITGDLTGSFELVEGEVLLELDDLGRFTAVTTWQVNDHLHHPQLVPILSAVAKNGNASLWATQLPKRSAQEQFDAVQTALAAQLPETIAQLPELPAYAARGASIAWRSSGSLIDIAAGTVTRPEPGSGDARTALAATITLADNTSKTVEFDVSVPARKENSLIAHYGFEANLEDKVGSRSPGITTGKNLHLPGGTDAKFADGRQGRALLLDGTYGLNLGTELLPYKSFTVSYWMKPTLIEPNQPSLFIIPETGDATYDGGTFFGVYNQINDWARTVTVWNRNGSDENWPFLASSYAAQLSVWQHVAVSCEQGNCALYINGQPAGEAHLGVVTGENAVLAIGVNLWDSSFVGLIDELRVYDEALSAAEIHALDYASTPKDQWLPIALQDVKQTLEAQNLNALKEDLALQKQGLFQSSITWNSSNPDAVTKTGKVSRPESGKPAQEATLTATVALNGQQQALIVPIQVVPERIPEPLVSYSFEGNLYDNQWNHSSDKLMGRHLMAKAEQCATARYKPGIHGKALYLDGTYGAILAEHLIMDDDYTISVWLKPEAFTLHTTALFWYVNFDQWLSLVPYDVNERMDVWTLKQGTYTDHLYATSLKANEWIQATVSVKGDEVVLYLNGERVRKFKTMPNLFTGHPTSLAVGINFWDKPYQGLIDELAIYPESIGDAEATTLYSQHYF